MAVHHSANCQRQVLGGRQTHDLFLAASVELVRALHDSAAVRDGVASTAGFSVAERCVPQSVLPDDPYCRAGCGAPLSRPG
eukprot:1771306-Prymnesium_polylepis.1